MLMALTREVSPSIGRCQLAHLPRVPIDVDRARAQHEAYEWALVEAGCTVRRLHAGPDMPDSVFIEDTAVVLDELALIARSGAASRRAEVPGVVDALIRVLPLPFRPLATIDAPGTLDGGDLLVVGRRAFIGASQRTNAAAIEQLRRMLTRLDYAVEVVTVDACLHLKSAVTAVAEDTLLINRSWVRADVFAGLLLVDVDPAEPAAANALRVGDSVICAAAFPRTRDRLEAQGVKVRAVDVSELAKAEGAVTCCSLVFEV